MAKEEVVRLRDLKVSARDLLMLPPDKIKIEKGYNPRDYELPENHAHLENLKASVKVHGIRVPLLVRFDPATRMAFIVDGECRFRAALELIDEGAEITSIPVVQVEGNDPAQRLVLSLTANTGKPLSKWEAGAAFQRLHNFGWEPQVIAEKLGFSLRYITEAMELTDAPESIKQLLSERAVTPALALDHIRKSGTGAVLTLRARADEAKAGGKKTAKRAKKAAGPKAAGNTESKLKTIAKLIQHAFEESDPKGDVRKLCEKLMDVLELPF